VTGQYAGTVLEVSSAPVGDVLAAAALAGATTLFIDDTSDFDPAEGGYLLIGAQVVQYTAVDDDAETITLAAPLAVNADVDDPVYVWDVGLNAIAKEYRALVAVPGALANDDALDAVIAQSLGALFQEGIRDPGTGETVVLEQQGTDWVIVDARSKGSAVGFTRATSTVTTDALAPGASGAVTVPLAPGYRLYAIAMSKTGRVTIYQTLAAQTADATRLAGVDPRSYDGVVLDYVAAVANTTYPLGPLVDGVDLEATPSSDIPMTITNWEGTSGPITVTLTWLRTE
jgi:hypothetical protein